MLHVINGEHYAGAERVQDLLAKHLPAYGFRVGLACVKLDLFDELRESRDAPLYDVRMRTKFDLWAAAKIARIVRRHGLSPDSRPYGADGPDRRHGGGHGGRADGVSCP